MLHGEQKTKTSSKKGRKTKTSSKKERDSNDYVNVINTDTESMSDWNANNSDNNSDANNSDANNSDANNSNDDDNNNGANYVSQQTIRKVRVIKGTHPRHTRNEINNQMPLRSSVCQFNHKTVISRYKSKPLSELSQTEILQYLIAISNNTPALHKVYLNTLSGMHNETTLPIVTYKNKRYKNKH